jgi:hypothetical protein
MRTTVGLDSNAPTAGPCRNSVINTLTADLYRNAVISTNCRFPQKCSDKNSKLQVSAEMQINTRTVVGLYRNAVINTPTTGLYRNAVVNTNCKSLQKCSDKHFNYRPQ